MSEVKNAVKKSHFGKQQPKTEAAILISENPALRAKIDGKTLWEVGQLFGLSDEDVKFNPSILPNGNRILQFALRVEGVFNIIPLAWGYDVDKAKNDADWFLTCRFRSSFKAKKEADGTPMIGDNGRPVLDELQPYMSFGKPSGITLGELENAFEEMTEEEEALAASKNS